MEPTGRAYATAFNTQFGGTNGSVSIVWYANIFRIGAKLTLGDMHPAVI
jgi:hypothetical protein